ncbi:M23 family metallopeptidase [Chondromyces apiculatus]|uniref:Metalloendopeptidase membrane protein n=1 Tax=Chondromyces apiculatus DSM 436 TaxID=1192034 RepID=A0A017STS0_9BACT|nr:M23 family metallopeptidase [Chondromyces apiculatus]EYF00157.1 metalloendopeptidase membrane protein [Chondromyces apiculatus DSM 436]
MGGDPQRLSSTFGPRLQVGREMAYDFHRGIDIPAPEGTSVLAIADGVVTRAGDDAGYSDTMVQVEHCGDDGCRWSNYLHLAEACVEVGDEVDAGDVVGLSGIAESGDEQLHFEIREGRSTQGYAVHPLRVLPGLQWAPPTVSIVAVDEEASGGAAVEVEVGTIGVDPALVRVEVVTRDRGTDATLGERVFDTEAWNREYTLEEDPGLIDTPEIDGIRVEPAPFTHGSVAYGLRVRFSGLGAVSAGREMGVTVKAVDAYGVVSEASLP